MNPGETVLVACRKNQLDKFQAQYHGQRGKIVAVGLTKVAVRFFDGQLLQFSPSLLKVK